MHGRSVNKENSCVAICRIALNLTIRASSGGKMRRIQHGAARDRKVNKGSCHCFFEYDQSFGHARGIIKTEQTLGSLGLRHSPPRRSPPRRSPPRRVVKSLGLAPSTFHYVPRGVNNYSLVTPRSVMSIYHLVS